MVRTIFGLTMALVGFPAVFGQTPKEPPTIAMKMEDQFEKPHDLKALKGDVVVLLFGDRKATEANSALGERLHVQFHPGAKGKSVEEARKAAVAPLDGLAQGQKPPEVHVVPVACIGKVPALVRSALRLQFEKASPQVPVWLDFEDAMKTAFGIEAGVPNLVVIDARNRLRFKSAGEQDAKSYERLVQVIDYLRKEAVAR